MSSGPSAKTFTSTAATKPALRTSIAFVVLFLLLEWLSGVRPLYALHVSPWSPQWGLALAFLVAFGGRALPAVALAVVAGEVLPGHAPPQAPATYLAALWLVACFAALAALWRRILAPGHELTALGASRLAIVSALGLLAAAFGFVTLHFAAVTLPGDDVLPAAIRWWIGSLNGVLVVTPLLALGPRGGRDEPVSRVEAADLLPRLLVVLVTLVAAFLLPAADQLRFFYLLFVPVVWIALRWQWRGALLAVLVVQLGLLVVAETRIPTARFIDLQFFLLVLTLTGLLLGLVVAEHARALARVEAGEAEQRALLAMAPDAILLTDAGGAVRTLNAAALHLFGPQAPGAPITRLLEGLALTANEGRTALTGRRGDQEAFPAEVAWARPAAARGQGHLVIVRDVTERRRAEAQLRERDAVLAGAMRFAVAGEMASALAHELNQPITALVSYLRACELLAPGDNERLRATLDKSVREAIRASDVLHRLRDFYQGSPPRSGPVRPSDLCRTVVAAFAERCRQAEAQLEFVDDPAAPTVTADATQLEIVLHNLLANALEAVAGVPADRRRVVLTLAHDGERLTFTVEDSGGGVTPTMQRTLFQPFVTDKVHGMGLGLAISQSLARAHGGDLVLQPGSHLGGARFVASLPLEPASR